MMESQENPYDYDEMPRDIDTDDNDDDDVDVRDYDDDGDDGDGAAAELTDPSMPALPPLPRDDVDVNVDDEDDGVDVDGDVDVDVDAEDDDDDNNDYPHPGGPATSTAMMPATTTATTATTTSKKRAAASVVARVYKSTLHFRTDLTKSARDVHPCGILHFARVSGRSVGGGVGPSPPPPPSSSSSYHRHRTEEHAFVWITRYHDEVCLSNALLHMSKFGFDRPKDGEEDNKNGNVSGNGNGSSVVFVPYSNRRSWIIRYPLAFPHVYCGDGGVVTGFPFWSAGYGCDVGIAGGGGGATIAARTGGRAHPPGGTAANDVPASSEDATTTTATDGGAGGPASGSGRRRRKIFPAANLTNDERDELHVEIYRYFRWLRDSLSLSTSSSASSHAAFDGGGIGGTTTIPDGTDGAFADRIDGGDTVLVGGAGGGTAGGDGNKRSSSNVGGVIGIGVGGGGYAAGGIKLSSLDDLMEGMKSAFKVVRGDHQANGGARPNPSHSSFSSPASDGMPFLEDALGEPLGRLAAMSRRDQADGRRGGDPSRGDGNNGRSGGLDFDDMYGRLVRFRQVRVFKRHRFRFLASDVNSRPSPPPFTHRTHCEIVGARPRQRAPEVRPGRTAR